MSTQETGEGTLETHKPMGTRNTPGTATTVHAARSALSLYGWPLNAGARNLLSKFYHPAALRALKAAA